MKHAMTEMTSDAAAQAADSSVPIRGFRRGVIVASNHPARFVRSVLTVLTITATAALAAPTTQPSAVLRLWPNDPPATRPLDDTDKFTDRTKSGAPTRVWINKVMYPTLAVYLPDSTTPTAAAVICPGGGYGGEAYTLEGVEVAEELARRGVAAFVLKYRLPIGQAPAADKLPLPQQDVLRAIQVVRHQAARFNVDPKHVGVFGFSAGGHLAATAATLYADPGATGTAADAVDGEPTRPDFAVLVYPVIAMDKLASHGGSRKNLIGENADAAMEQRFAADNRVTKDTPPLFIVHARDDKTVPLVNAERMAAAATKAGVANESAIYATGGHGFGLGNNAENRTWLPKALAWLRGRGALGG